MVSFSSKTITFFVISLRFLHWFAYKLILDIYDFHCVGGSQVNHLTHTHSNYYLTSDFFLPQNKLFITSRYEIVKSMSLDDVQLMIYDEYRISRTAFSSFFRIFSLTSAPRQTLSSSLSLLFIKFSLSFQILFKFFIKSKLRKKVKFEKFK